MNIGERVIVHGKQNRHYGILRFFGATLFKDGNWCGIELDRPLGKNDGSVKGVRYFHCKPMYGLFARPETIEVVHPGASNAGAHLRNAHAAAPNTITSSPRVASSTVSGRMRDAIDAPENAVAVVASVFRFNKQTNQWAEVGTGTLKLAFKLDQVTKKDLRISLDGQQRSADGAFVRHYIEPDTALEPNVGSDRAWVFRANDAVQLTGEVLALQFASASAAKRFEAHFQKLSAMYHIISEAEKERASPPSGTQPPPPAPSTYMSHANYGSGAMMPPSAPPAAPQNYGQRNVGGMGMAQQPSPSSSSGVGAGQSSSAASRGIRGQRRRLSVVSDNPNIEGIRRASIASTAAADTADSGKGIAGTIVREYHGVSKKGYAPYNAKKDNQDICFMKEDPGTNAFFFGVFDGHGEQGHHVTRFVKRNLPGAVVTNPKWLSDVGGAMRDEILKAEQQLLRNRSIDTALSGSTCCCATIRGDILTVVNIGDSRLILGVRDARGRIVPKEVSIDHKPDLPEEQRLIEATGGRVWAMKYDDGIDGPARVWLKDQNLPGLAMSRSICDEVAKRAGVISEPEIFNLRLESNVVFLCCASDGLWEFMTNEDVVGYISACGGNPVKAVDALMKESKRRWQREEPVIDDTSIIVAFMNA
eukprot:g2531.t1